MTYCTAHIIFAVRHGPSRRAVMPFLGVSSLDLSRSTFVSDGFFYLKSGIIVDALLGGGSVERGKVGPVHVEHGIHHL